MPIQTHKEGNVSFDYDSDDVFFNPTQVFNRDFSVMVISHFIHVYRANSGRPVRILDALSASGLRALRYAREIGFPGPLHVIANDISTKAAENIRRNASLNPSPAHVQFEVTNQDAIELLFKSTFEPGPSFTTQKEPTETDASSERKPTPGTPPSTFDVIDIDPYGHPTPFVRAALRAAADGALLCLTATDGMITCGRQPGECLIRYGCQSANSRVWCHEGSIRIVLGSIAREAASLRYAIVPLVSFFHNHYLRVFIRVFKRKRLLARQMFSSLATVYHCPNCTMFLPQTFDDTRMRVSGPRCRFCNTVLHVTGPIWYESIHDTEFLCSLQKCMSDAENADSSLRRHCASWSEISAHIEYAIGENETGTALGYDPVRISAFMRTSTMPVYPLCAALESLGYKIGPMHTVRGGFKTDAEPHVILAIYAVWFLSLVTVGARKREDYPINTKILPMHLLSGLSDSEIKAFQEYLPASHTSGNSKDQALAAIRLMLNELCSASATPTDAGAPTLSCSGAALSFQPRDGAARRWFKRTYKDSNGQVVKRAAIFLAHPEKHWGPKKMK